MKKPPLTLVLVEAALETIPREIVDHLQVRRRAEKTGKPPRRLILDRSYHYGAMAKLKDKEKRGRPDIVHFCLLETLGSPLNLEGLLQVYVHTYSGYVVKVSPETKLPRNYNRFIGLMEQLFEERRVPPSGRPLLTLKRQSLTDLLKTLKPSLTIALTRRGKPEPVLKLAWRLTEAERPAVLVGGFPHGTFSPKTLRLADEAVAIDPDPLDSWIAVSRIISAYEQATGLPEARIRKLRWPKPVRSILGNNLKFAKNASLNTH